ncbi:MAG: hypothetical protein KAU14_05365, partial [Thermoplasmata archaeon]|nr:hypothetical protein [Thermoplasmata archaeon]
NEEKKAYFYLNVRGEILAGVRVPSTRAMSEPSYSDYQVSTESGEIIVDDTPLPVQTGEDAIYIFLDTNGEAVRNKGFLLPVEGEAFDKDHNGSEEQETSTSGEPTNPISRD